MTKREVPDMTDEEVRKAAAEAFDRTLAEGTLSRIEAVYRAGMAAGRAAERRGRGGLADPEAAGDMAALLRRLESDPEEAARFLAEVDTRGLLKAKPKRRKADQCTVERPGCVESQTWADWLALRKAKKAAVTQTVLNAAWREAAKAEMSLEAFLQVWCFRGSQGLEAAWLTPQERGRGPGPNGPAPESSRAREARERVERVAPGAARKTVHPLVADADRIWYAVTGGADDARPKRIG